MRAVVSDAVDIIVNAFAFVLKLPLPFNVNVFNKFSALLNSATVLHINR
jgi:hypothetical protein